MKGFSVIVKKTYGSVRQCLVVSKGKRVFEEHAIYRLLQGKLDRLRSMSSGSDSTSAHSRTVVPRKHQKHGAWSKHNINSFSVTETADKRRVVYYATNNNASSFRQVISRETKPSSFYFFSRSLFR